MRLVIWLVLLFVAAVVAALYLGANDGLVSVYSSGWRLDISLNLFLLILVASCFALVTAIQAIEALTTLPKRAREWRLAQRERSAQLALREALVELFGARFSRAQKAAQKALNIQSATPELAADQSFMALAHLLAAASAHRLQDRRHRDEQLNRALELAHRAGGARAQEDGARLLAAEWALDDRDAARALGLLSELAPGVARRTQALRLKLQAARLARQPLEALRTARLLAKHQGFSPAAAQGLMRALAVEALDAARDAEQVQGVWREFDAADRRDVVVVSHAARRLVALGAAEDARLWLRPLWERVASLPREERDVLALALAQASPGIGPEWLPRLESALQQGPREGAMAYAVGCALAERELWGKAQQLLEQAAQDDALQADARRDAWLRLAAMAERDRDEDRAARCYRAAALLA